MTLYRITCFIVAKYYFFVTLLLLFFPLTTNASTILDQWFENQIETDWDEYDDRSQALWQHDVSPIYVNKATESDLLILPGIDTYISHTIVQERSKGPYTSFSELLSRTGLFLPNKDIYKQLIRFDDPTTWDGRVHVKAKQRFGEQSDADHARYNGSPFGLTQRYTLSGKSLQFGATLDKARFEPAITDLNRCYITHKTDRVRFIAGDFHVTSGNGLVLWTRPAFFSNLRQPSSYKSQINVFRPAVESVQNSGLRGFAFHYNWDKADYSQTGRQINLFAARTLYDATVDESGVQRLSSSGLHRSDGESSKKNSITESSFGWTFEYPIIFTDWDITLATTGYLAQYNHPFTPSFDFKDRFPITGDRVGAMGTHARFVHIAQNHVTAGYCEVASDYDENIAWSVLLNRTGADSYKWYLALYHYPADYHNLHAKPPTGSSKAQNQSGASILVLYYPDVLGIRTLSAHMEVEKHPWRTYTIPHPYSESKGSAECVWRSWNRSELKILYRRKDTIEGNGEAGITDEATEQKVRFMLSNVSFWGQIGKIWLETAIRKVETGPIKFGSLIGTSVNGWIFGQVLYDVRVVCFSTESGHYLYQGESGLPDRFASVLLSQQGFRWTGALTWRQGKNNWLAVQTARTLRWKGDSSDTDLFVTFSHTFQHEN